MLTTEDAILVTGCAGFIGYHLTHRLLKEGKKVIGLDNLNPYYDVQLKIDRLNQLKSYSDFTFVKANLEDTKELTSVFNGYKVRTVIHLAAQAGVRYSLEDPESYISSNVVGFLNVLEACRHHNIEHLIYASSSSVYGTNTNMPFSTKDQVDHPMSIYAASKKANELMAHSYSHLFDLKTTGLRFFTVYGPWGRPDMALFKFSKAILEGKEIEVYNYGKMKRDFTYVDDIVEGILRVKDHQGKRELYKVYNIGNHTPVYLMDFISVLEKKLGMRAKKNFLPLQAGDVPETYADITDLMKDVGFHPNTSVDEGVERFVDWYKDYYDV